MTLVKTIRLTFFVIMLHCIIPVAAQQNQTMYFMDIPQARFMNPAFQNSCNFYIGFPGINSTYLGINSNTVGFNDIVFYGRGEYSDSLITFLHPSYDVDEFLNKLKPVNRIAPEMQLTAFSMGFWSGENYISVDIVDKMNSQFTFPDDLAILLLKGNEPFINNTVDLTSLSLDVTYYREFGLGYSRKFSNRLTLGMKAKVLFGMANISMQNNELSVSIDESDLYSHNIKADVTLNIAYPLDIYKNSEGDIDSIKLKEIEPNSFLFDFSNPGFGIDIGGKYDINDKFSVSASVIDLGFIRWKKDVTNLTSKGEFKYEGIDVSSEFNAYDTMELGDVVEAFGDSLLNTFKPVDTYNPYTTWTSAKVYIGGVFHLSEKIHFGILSKTIIQHGKLWQSFTASANATVARFLTTSLSYSITNSTYNNIGFGLGIRGGPFQIYFITDKIFYKLSKYNFEGDTSILLPSDLNNFNFRFGLNLMFGCKPGKYKDLPLIQ